MTQPPPLIDALRRLAGSGPDERSDAELLAAFVAGRDPAAFAALVHRRLACRACEALELPAADAGKRLLVEWAAGPADAARTREAQAALKRLAGGGRG